MSKEYQASEKGRRSKEHTETLGRMERCSVRCVKSDDAADYGLNARAGGTRTARMQARTLFEVGSCAWLYMERVKPGLVKKLAQLWYGPFCIKAKVEGFAMR
ncbi:hypothetical protein PC128_g24776 [Phytophthora cactorum]|nr:hypothetical protein PC120_g16044 [Phytophthora cactorum]KAG3142450.1 hypothetical protein PC128_g24776 [Phytophthora cactorum]